MWQVGLQAQTILDITSIDTRELDGVTSTNDICPGKSYEILFDITSGQINPFANIDVLIVDTNNLLNPFNNTVVGNTSFNFALTAGATAIPIDANIPLGLPAGNYLFYISVNAASVTPAPFSSDSTDIERTQLQLPTARMVVDTSALSANGNIFRTDSGVVLRSFNPVTGLPIAGGEDAVSATPVPSRVDSTINFCAGDSLFLWNPDSLNGNTAHIWKRNGVAIPTANANSGHLWVSESGYYSLVVENSNTCDDSSAFIGVGRSGAGGSFTAGVEGIYFNSYDVDTSLTRTGPGNALGGPTRFCIGDSVVLSARQSSSHPQGTYTYQWVANGGDSISTNFEIVVRDAGTYEVYINETIGNSFSCQAKSNLIQVQIDSVPRIAIAPNDSVGVLPGNSVPVTASVTNGVAGTAFTWYRSPTNNVVANGASFNVTTPGTYYVEGVSPSGCTGVDTLYVEDLSRTNLSVNSFNTLNLDGSFTLEICPGSMHELEFVVEEGQINPFAIANVMILDAVNPVNPINNTVVGSYPNGATPIVGTVGSPSAPILVDVTIPFGINPSNYFFYMQVAPGGVNPSPAESDSVQRTLIPNPRSRMVLDTSTVTYGNTFLTDSTLILKSFDPILGPIPGGEDFIPLAAVPVPNRRDSTVNFCNGDSLYLWNPDSLSANEHKWLLNGAPFPTNTTNDGHIWVYQSGYYSLITERANTCEDSVAYIGVGRLGNTTVGLAGIYFNAYDVDTTLIRTGVGNAVGKPTRFCVGDSVVLSARQTSSHPLGYYEYQWVANGTDTISTDFEITVKDAGSFEVYVTEVIDSSFTCKVLSNLVQIEVDPIPGAEINTFGATVCFGDTIVVQDTNVYEPSNVYTWFANGQNLLGVFGDTNFIKIDTTLLSTIGIGADTNLFVTLMVTDTLGCDSVSAPAVFDFQLYPDIQLTQDSLALCVGDSVLVSAFTVNGVSAVFTWYDTPGNNVVSTNSNYLVGGDGVYWVEAEGPNGCSKTDTLIVTDLTVFADAGPNQVVDSGAVVQLGASGGVDYYWYASSPVYFNNPFDAAAQTIPTQDTTIYYVEVTGANGCSDIDSMFVFVREKVKDPLADIANTQNVITPNGDGINDVLDLSGVMDGDACEFRLLNRWGSEVYVDGTYGNDWEGQDSGGNLLPDGTYYYTLRCPGDDFRFKGAVTILSGNSN